MDKKDLKIIALRERLRDIIAEYEEKVVELRIAITVELAERDAKIEELEAKIAESKEGDVED